MIQRREIDLLHMSRSLTVLSNECGLQKKRAEKQRLSDEIYSTHQTQDRRSVFKTANQP